MVRRANYYHFYKNNNKLICVWLESAVPILKWLPNYNIKNDLLWDIAAGAAVAAVLIPQSMAMSILAGLPPVYGLYSAWVPSPFVLSSFFFQQAWCRSFMLPSYLQNKITGLVYALLGNS